MNRCGPFPAGPVGLDRDKRGLGSRARQARRAFTLLEICIVLFIIALLAAISMPAIQSAFAEQALRNDSHQLALMVKTAMLQSAEQHRPYVIELTAATMALHPLDDRKPDADEVSSAASDESSDLENVETSIHLDRANTLLAPDPDKANAWIAMPKTKWLFRSGYLCPIPRLRLTRGEAWLEMSFNALTGNVEDEAYSFP
jgi:prepilin-type N-terminal cleavage/methylation domain-containing protein